MYWTMREGDLIANYSSSGAGYGDPLERDPEEVLRDLRRGIISFKVSQQVYKVVFSDRRASQLDSEKTAEARKKAVKRDSTQGYPIRSSSWHGQGDGHLQKP